MQAIKLRPAASSELCGSCRCGRSNGANFAQESEDISREVGEGCSRRELAQLQSGILCAVPLRSPEEPSDTVLAPSA